MMPNELKLFNGGLAVDDRGQVGFVNDFNFAGVKRFYTVSNHRRNFIRAWHAHRKEAKYVTVVQGVALIGAVAIDDWERPSKSAQVTRHVLSANKPAIVLIPAGYANGFMSLTDDALVVFFSTSTLEESLGDDVRYDARYWDIWDTVER
jgi:dTDP-4-dehydrorhamnose 3,5-epimerase